MNARPIGIKNVGIIGIVAGLAILAVACTVTVSGGSAGSPPRLVITFGLGQTGIFSISAGLPVSNQAVVSGLDKPSQTPTVALLRVQSSDVTVTPLASGQEVESGGSVSGSFVVSFRLASENATDPCAAGIDVGSISGTMTDGQASLAQDTLTVPSQAVTFAAAGTFTMCITVEADFSGVFEIANVSFVYNPENDELPVEGGDDVTPTNTNNNDNANADDGSDDGNDVADDNADDDGSNDGSDDNPDISNDNSATDDNPVDDGPDDNPAESRLSYSNLTNDEDQDPDISTNTRNSQPTIDDAGNVIAYLSNVDTTGENGEFPNDEIMVLAGLTKIQVTSTTDITNSSDNTYEVSNWGPIVSSDGAVVAFGSDGNLVSASEPATDQIYLYEVDTGQMHQLSSLDTPAGGIQKDWVGYPRVGGPYVAWIENDTECSYFGCAQQQRLRVTNRSGGEILTVVFDATLSFDDYALSGDGEEIVFVSNLDPVGLNEVRYTQLFTMGVGGGSISQVSLLTSSAAGWSPRYQAPNISPSGDSIAVWTNDPAITSTEDLVLALLDRSGSLLRVLAQAGVDFPSGEDATGRPRFSADGAYVAFATSWSFGFTQRNFRAATDGSELLELGVGYKSLGPSMTSDGSDAVIAGVGNEFIPDQTSQNEDWNDEIWYVRIAP